ncbi:hypothetical protein HBH70_071730 [Parastagonospora nodorum]|nr:hypothetical protein HBH53_100960 [Parastagonospora nodorum]KAH3970041.1 hypothetical protein HBH51_118200 [Parastagonospora nodorum]KAH3988681.1 hypothetical protein HBH52_026900 [Parastagonospora nodorum]KAH4037246.1 hypothetical protein HBI09_067930 [Parastagonospora nodorum]KAH4119544.1 hypothetical protein HBH47_121170 [Parastagonospora nodorum]
MRATTEGAAKTITAPKALPRLSAPEVNFATIIVGSDQKRFVVHQGLLTHYSEFFRAALTGRFKEAEDKVVKLEDQSPRIFEVFVHWLYYQRFPDADHNDGAEIIELFQDEACLEKRYNSVGTLIKLYVFADRHDVEKLRLATINELFQRVLETVNCPHPTATSIEFAFEHLDVGSPLCHFLADVTCYVDILDPLDPDDVNSLPFMRMLWLRYKEMIGKASRNDDELQLCDYHEHADKEEREECEAKREKESSA